MENWGIDSGGCYADRDLFYTSDAVVCKGYEGVSDVCDPFSGIIDYLTEGAFVLHPK